MHNYIIFAVLLSFLHSLNLYYDAKERPATRRLVSTHSLNLPAITNPPPRYLNHNLPVATYNIRELHVFVAENDTPPSEDTKLTSFVRVYIDNLGIFNFALMSLTITNVWGGAQLQPLE